MSRNIGFAALVAMTVGSASLAHALPLTVDPTSGWTLEGALRPSLAPLGLGGHVNWTGFYVGVNGGGVWDGATTAEVSTIYQVQNSYGGSSIVSVDGGGGGGFIGGAQVGYDFQWPFGLVTGLEADFQGLTNRTSGSLSTTELLLGQGSINAVKRVDDLGTVRLRFGYQIAPGLLTYATGGFAYGHAGLTGNTSLTSFDANGNPMAGAASLLNYSAGRIGWAFGAGAEVPLWSNLTGKIEYLRYDLGTAYTVSPWVVNPTGSLGFAEQATVHFSGNVVRVGVNYRFGSDAPAPLLPLVAKY